MDVRDGMHGLDLHHHARTYVRWYYEWEAAQGMHGDAVL